MFKKYLFLMVIIIPLGLFSIPASHYLIHLFHPDTGNAYDWMVGVICSIYILWSNEIIDLAIKRKSIWGEAKKNPRNLICVIICIGLFTFSFGIGAFLPDINSRTGALLFGGIGIFIVSSLLATKDFKIFYNS